MKWTLTDLILVWISSHEHCKIIINCSGTKQMVLEDGRVASFSGLWVFRFPFFAKLSNAVGVFAVFLPLKINACWYSENLCRCLALRSLSLSRLGVWMHSYCLTWLWWPAWFARAPLSCSGRPSPWAALQSVAQLKWRIKVEHPKFGIQNEGFSNHLLKENI